MTQQAGAGGSRTAELAVRIGLVVALVIDAVVHIRLASNYQLAAPGGIGGGTLFRLQAAAAVAAAIYLLIRGSRVAYAVAGLVALSAFVAVVLYRYVDVPAIGPIPPMYEPFWYFEKSLSAIAEGIGVLLAGCGILLTSRRPKPAAGPRQR